MAVTFRNNASQTALPVRNWGAFMLGNGVGGGGRALERRDVALLCRATFILRSHLTQRYGANSCPRDMTIQDWGITYDDLEPHYDQVRVSLRHVGHSRQHQGQDPGRAAIRSKGRVRGRIRRRPQKQGYGHTLFAEAAKQLGYKPFPQPSGNLSQAYTNPLGV